MEMQTETIDRLFLELSQFTQATTAKEIKYKQQRVELLVEIRLLLEPPFDAKCDCRQCNTKRDHARALIAKIEVENQGEKP